MNMFDREEYKLNSKEQVKQTILRILLFMSFVVVAKGIYNENKNINQDFLLWPIFSISSGFFCLIYSINAFTTGNLVRRWVNDTIFNYFIFSIQKRKLMTEKKAIDLATKILGIIILFISVSLFISAIIYYISPFSV